MTNEDETTEALSPEAANPSGGMAPALAAIYLFFAVTVVAPVALLVYGGLNGSLPLLVAGGVLALVGAAAVREVVGRPVAVRGGEVVDRDRQPTLWAVVDATVEAVGAAPIDEMVLVHDVELFLAEEVGWFGLRVKHRTVAIGIGLVNTLRTDELQSLLTHELGHAVALGSRSAKVHRGRSLAQRIVAAPSRSPMAGPVNAYLRVFLRLSAGSVRRTELAADALAARVCGADAMVGALRMKHIAGPALDRFLAEYAAPVWAEGAYPIDLYPGFRAFLTAPGRRAFIGGLRATATHSEADPGDGHPPLSHRLAALARMEDGSLIPEDPQSARNLLRDPAGVEEGISRLVAASVVKSEEPEPVLMTDGDGLVWLQSQLRRAVLLTRATARIGTDRGLVAALEVAATDGSMLASLLAPALAEGPAEDREAAVDEVVREHVRAAMGSALVDHVGCRWKVDWNGPLRLLGPEGQEVPIDDWVDEVMRTGEVGRAVAWLTRTGVPVPTAA